MEKCNDSACFYAAKPLRPGDVILSVDGATSQAAMVEKLKKETSLTAEIVRYSKFDAFIETDSTSDGNKPTQTPLGMTVSRTNGKIVIDKIDVGPSPIKRYNEQNYFKPLVSGDVIVAVNSKKAFDEMIQQMKTSTKLILSIERHQDIGRPRVHSHATKTERYTDSGGEVAQAA
jgi:hypothetical protein